MTNQNLNQRARRRIIPWQSKSPSSLNQSIAPESASMISPGDQVSDNEKTSPNSMISRMRRSLVILQTCAFLLILANSLVSFAPAPALMAKLGTERATHTLSVLSATAALAQILFSPLFGSILDSFGRKPIFLSTILAVVASHGLVCLNPSVVSICAAKVVGMFCMGLFIITSQAITSDVFSVAPARQLSSAMGIQMALINAGFLVGAVVAGRLAEWNHGLSVSYGMSAAVGILAALLVGFGMHETLAPSRRIPWDHGMHKKLLLQSPLACTSLLTRHGSEVRVLAILLILQSLPIHMGDAFQIFAKTEWNLTTKDFSSFVAMYGVLGIVANMAGSWMVQKLGIKLFTAVTTLSSMLSPFGAALFGFQGMVTGSLLGFLGLTQTLGVMAALVSESGKSDVPQGELAGERAAMMSLLKAVGPLWYSVLYVQGHKWVGVKNLPFLFNIGLAVAALSISHAHLP